MGLAKKTDVMKVQEETRRLRPMRGVGVLTSSTTRGVGRQVIRRGNNNGGNNAGFVPRWG